MIAANLQTIRTRIAAAAARAHRSPDEVRLVAAAKGQGRIKIEEAIAAGVRIIGHNYVQEAAHEIPSTAGEGIEFHMIGHLQKNKAGKAVELFHTIQTVDDAELAAVIDHRAETGGRVLKVMIQVNLAGEVQKSGIDPAGVEALACSIRDLPHLKLVGLMTMPPFFDDPEGSRLYFARLRELREKLMSAGILTPEMPELSMGMTGDFEVAVEEGATLVRIGTALFGPRT